ncbi:MAG: response regulator transcription factor [Clostridia bacterium]|nr:response regulator transcription factor [Clostridia bacterium]
MQGNVLIADDDPKVVEELSLYLENSGMRVFPAENGLTALSTLQRNSIQLMLLDVMLPDMSGYELLKRIRSESPVPIILLSAKGQDSDRILGLDLGADDYIVKPFNPLEVAARARAQLRRYLTLAPVPKEQVLTAGELRLDPASLTLTRRGALIPVTLAEYKILFRLMRSPGEVFSKRQLYACINLTAAESGRNTMESDENTVMVHISKIREKIEDDPRAPRYIKTVRNQGYRFAYRPR